MTLGKMTGMRHGFHPPSFLPSLPTWLDQLPSMIPILLDLLHDHDHDHDHADNSMPGTKYFPGSSMSSHDGVHVHARHPAYSGYHHGALAEPFHVHRPS